MCAASLRSKKKCIDAIEQALDRARQLQQQQELASRIKRCKDFGEGQELQAEAALSGMDRLPVVGNTLIQMFGELGRVGEARAAFNRLLDPGVVSWNVLLTAYAQNGHIGQAKVVFDGMPVRSVVSWNAMISSLAAAEDAREAMLVFRTMNLYGEKPVRATYLSALEAMATGDADARGLEESIVESGMGLDVAVGTALVKFLSKSGKDDQAWTLFLDMPSRNVITWTTILGALIQNGKVTESKAVFDRMPLGNTVSWNTMVCGYVQTGHSRDALAMFLAMDIEGMEPDRITFAAAVEACSQLSDFAQGHGIHSEIVSKTEVAFDLGVTNALIDLYGRCGRMDLARWCFDRLIDERVLRCNSVPWTSLIGHYARNGYPEEAIELFHAMALEGLSQSPVLFISVLCCCSHGGNLDVARRFFVSMTRDFGVAPAMDHFMCMVDLLARNGKLDEAQDLVQALDADVQSEELIAWRTLGAACKSHGDARRGRGAVERAIAVDEAVAGPYVMLSTMI